jgi:hypothetical protein
MGSMKGSSTSGRAGHGNVTKLYRCRYRFDTDIRIQTVAALVMTTFLLVRIRSRPVRDAHFQGRVRGL